MKRLLTVSILAVLTLVLFTPGASATDKACCPCGPGCKCEPGSCPGKCPVLVQAKTAVTVSLVEYEILPDRTRITYTHTDGKVYAWGVYGGPATDAIAAKCVASVYCAEGKCPLTAPKVKLQAKAAPKKAVKLE